MTSTKPLDKSLLVWFHSFSLIEKGMNNYINLSLTNSIDSPYGAT